MGGLIYQLKSVWKDKFCIMSFLLPVIVALALRLIGGIDLSSVTEFHFGVLEGELSERTLSWLEGYGSVTVYETQEKLSAAVNDPATNLIGVEAGTAGIETMVFTIKNSPYMISAGASAPAPVPELFCFRICFCELSHDNETAGAARRTGGKGHHLITGSHRDIRFYHGPVLHS